jgi:hypothetical protein
MGGRSGCSQAYREGVNAVNRMLRVARSSPHAFRSARKMTDTTRRWRRFASAVVLGRKGRGILLRVSVQRFFTVLCMAEVE